MKYKLRHYQEEAATSAIKYLQRKKGNPLIALPTGSGKSLVLAELVRYVVEEWNGRVMILSHVKEILEQNYKHIVDYTGYEVAMNSSMLGRREYGQITVAGIQSVYRNPRKFHQVQLVIIDEAHLVSMDLDTMYQKFLAGIGHYVCVGLTATPFRLGDGYIYGKDKLFGDLVSDWCTAERFVQLIDEGFLCKLTTKRTELEMDTSGINLVAGDFNEKQLSDKFDREIITNEAIKEIIAAGKNRKKWLIFAIDINHAEHIAEMLIRNGIPTAPVHSKMKDSGFDRDKSIEGFRYDRYKCVVNVNILTTGFDHPGVDLIALLRPTQSPVLHVQTLGRGSRIDDGKSDCLVLDFAGNTARLGPVNNVLVRVKGKGLGGGEPITKTCPRCQSILPPAVKFCPDCNFEFIFEHGLSMYASEDIVIEEGKDYWMPVLHVDYSIHARFGSPSSLKVSYKISSRQSVSEWICVEHKGFAKHKADHWIKYRGGPPCSTVEQLLSHSDELSIPTKILIQKRGKHFVIKDSNFAEN
jgi:DNA repair protein RadD